MFSLLFKILMTISLIIGPYLLLIILLINRQLLFLMGWQRRSQVSPCPGLHLLGWPWITCNWSLLWRAATPCGRKLFCGLLPHYILLLGRIRNSWMILHISFRPRFQIERKPYQHNCFEDRASSGPRSGSNLRKCFQVDLLLRKGRRGHPLLLFPLSHSIRKSQCLQCQHCQDRRNHYTG